MRRSIATLIVALVATLLTAAAAAAETPTPFSAMPTSDGFVTDSGFDGYGDYIVDGQASVLVGFNAYDGPGEHRGVYEFDISSVAHRATILSATLGLNLVGSRLDGTDHALTLYSGRGNGLLDLADFALPTLVTGFDAVDSSTTHDDFENVLDVTPAVQMAVDNGEDFAAFVIRPNPNSRLRNGSWLFSSTEIGVFSPQFFPAELTIEFTDPPPDSEPPELTLPESLTANATAPDGASVTYWASALDDGRSIPVTCAPASGSTFSIGDTTVSCTATDAAGNQAAGSFVVHVAGSKEQLEAFTGGILADSQLAPAVKTALAARLQPLLAAFDPTRARDRILACVTLGTLVRFPYGALGVGPDRAAELVADAMRMRQVLACG